MQWILNGVGVVPRNVFDITLDTDWTGRPSELEVGADSLVLPREGLDVVLQWRAAYGTFHGIPLQAITNSGTTLEYYVDLSEDALYGDFEAEVSVKKRGGKDNFFDQANQTDFEMMAADGVVFTKVAIPYVIVKDNAVELALSLGISIYMMTKELIDQIISLSTTITQIIDAVTPSTGTGVTFNIGQIITLIVKALLQIAIIALILVALVKLSQQFFELIFPKVRYFDGTKVKHLIQKGCEYLGYTLESSLLDALDNLTILPIPLVKDKDSILDFIQNDLNFAFTKGFPTLQDSTPSLGSLISAVEKQFNARTRVKNGVVQIEIRNFWEFITPNQTVPALNFQGERTNKYRLNTPDVWRRTLIAYQTDFSDIHTLDFFDPTDAEYSTEPASIPNADLVTIKGLNNIQIPFALGVRKKSLNWIEKLAKSFFEVIDEVIEAFGGNGNYAAQITNRIGVLQIGGQFFSKTKMLWTIGGKQPANYASIIRASAIYNGYHKINEIQVNDYKVFEKVPVRMTSEDFVNLLDNNFAEIDGLVCELLTIKFFEDQSHAVISYKQPFDYANGKVYVKAINT